MALDFKRVALAALAQAHELVPRWLPAGRAEGYGERSEWVAVNPRRPSSDGSGAFRINLTSGAWADFAGTDKGGDLISLLAYIRAIGNGDACKQLADELGIPAGDGAAPAFKPRLVNTGPAPASPPPPPRPAPRAPARDLEGEQVVPVPLEAPPWEDVALDTGRFGRATATWQYHNDAGDLVLVVARYPDPAKGPGEKQFWPWTLWRRADGRLVWRPKTLPAPRPLYRLHEITRRRDARVIVCEGEKAADAAQLLFPDDVATTALNGAQSPQKSDWSPLEGRRVLVWPDHDAPGIAYANKVVALAHDAGAAAVDVLAFSWVAAAIAAATAEGAA